MTPASLDELLKEWEKEAQASIEEAKSLNDVWGVETHRDSKIISLIAVVRKQRATLKFYAESDNWCFRQYGSKKLIPYDGDKTEAEDDAGSMAEKTLTEAERILKG